MSRDEAISVFRGLSPDVQDYIISLLRLIVSESDTKGE